MKSIEGFFNEYRYLSNFHEKEFTYKGRTFPTSEHAYQAYKATNLQDFEWVRNSSTPREARKRGQKIKSKSDFDEIKYDLMMDILIEKFKDEELKQKLLNTGDAYLEETNYWHDNFWGVCTCDDCQHYTAQNNLGKILMEIRKNSK
jgi:ribA/ribD-fused uncharacterized protein